MKKTVTILDKIISKIATNFVIILFAIIIIGMLFINSIYLYIDMPDFAINHIWNYLGIIINLGVLLILIILHKYLEIKFSENKYIDKIMFLLYFIAGILFLKLVPIRPFSDMQQITDIALSNFENKMEYLQTYPNNLPITIIFNIIFRITTYDIFILKIVNIICNIATIYFSYRIYKNVYQKENKMVLLLGICSISAFLYVNHIYNDIIFTALTTIILYVITKEKQTRKDIIMISILGFLQFIIRPVGIILIIAISMYFILKKKSLKEAMIVILIFIIGNVTYSQIERVYLPKGDEIQEYPIWSFIQMGINEEEFGFQDGSHATDWTFGDVKNRIHDLGVGRLIKLLCKKQFWLWTEGTYQVERYAFGVGESETFFYETPVTKLIYDTEHSKVRKALEYLMKGQYFIFIFLSLMDLVIKDKNEETKAKKELLFYIIIGLFCFYMIWEMKSRYIYCLYPIFIILSASGIEKVISKIKINKERRLNNNGKV